MSSSAPVTPGPNRVSPFNTPAPPEAARPDGNVRLIRLPASLSHVERSVKLEGKVIARNDDGTVRIRTEQGDIDVQPRDARAAAPKEGESVQIEIASGNPPRTGEVKPAPAPAAQAPAPLPEETLQTTPSQTPVKIDIRFETLAPPEPEALLPPQQPTLPVNQPVEAKALTQAQIAPYAAAEPFIQSIAAPIPALLNLEKGLTGDPVVKAILQAVLNTLPQNTPAASLQTSPQIFSVPDPASLAIAEQTPPDVLAALKNLLSAAPGLSAPLAQETPSITVQIKFLPAPETPLLISGPNEPAPQTAAPDPSAPQAVLQTLNAGEVPGVVLGQTANKLPIIALLVPQTQSPALLVIQTPVAHAQPGEVVGVSLSDQAVRQLQESLPFNALPQAINDAFFLTPGSWPALQDIQQTIAAAAPQLAANFAHLTPSPAAPANFAAAALFFIAAVRGGDLSSWLGDRVTDALKRGGRESLFARLSQEGAALNRLSADPISNDWRGMTIPLLWQNEMQKMALFYKQNEGGGKDGGAPGAQTRFIFDLKLNQMGKVQLDGLSRPAKLDLIVRTETPLSGPMQMAMRRAYGNALDQAGLSGELSFQNRPEQWFTIAPDQIRFGGEA